MKGLEAILFRTRYSEVDISLGWTHTPHCSPSSLLQILHRYKWPIPHDVTSVTLPSPIFPSVTSPPPPHGQKTYYTSPLNGASNISESTRRERFYRGTGRIRTSESRKIIKQHLQQARTSWNRMQQIQTVYYSDVLR